MAASPLRHRALFFLGSKGEERAARLQGRGRGDGRVAGQGVGRASGQGEGKFSGQGEAGGGQGCRQGRPYFISAVVWAPLGYQERNQRPLEV